MPLSLDLLRVFESAARQLSFTAAAEELGTTQPAVSQQIKRLEKELATPLFQRVHRGIVLTDAGQLLLRHVAAGLETIDAGIAALGARQRHEVLQVATDYAFAAYWLMPRLPVRSVGHRSAADSGGAQLRQLHLADPGGHRRPGRGYRLAPPGRRPARTGAALPAHWRELPVAIRVLCGIAGAQAAPAAGRRFRRLAAGRVAGRRRLKR